MSKFEGRLEPKKGLFETPTEPASHTVAGENPLDLDEELFGALSFRIASGEIDPETTTLHAFEAEQLEKIRLQEAQNNPRPARGRTRGKSTRSEKKSPASTSAAVALRQEFVDLQNQLKAAQAAKTESERELAVRHTQIAELEDRLAMQNHEPTALREENERLRAQVAAAEKRIAALESALVATPPTLPSYENENRAPREPAEDIGGETTRMSRRLAEAESILSAAQTRLRQVEGNVAKVNTERARISTALNEERRFQELIGQRTQFETLQERARESERALREARKHLQPLAEQVRIAEQRTSKPPMKRDPFQERLAELDAELTKRQSELKNLQQAPAAPARAAPPVRTSVSDQAALARAEETNTAFAERIGRLEAALVAEKEDAAAAIEEIKAALRREKMERLATEGALETARKDFARLMRKAAAVQQEKATPEPTTPSRSARAA